VEATAAGKLERRHDYAAAFQANCDIGCGKIVGVEHDQRSAFGWLWMRLALEESAVDARTVEAYVIRAVVGETPAEDGGIELLRAESR